MGGLPIKGPFIRKTSCLWVAFFAPYFCVIVMTWPINYSSHVVVVINCDIRRIRQSNDKAKIIHFCLIFPTKNIKKKKKANALKILRGRNCLENFAS